MAENYITNEMVSTFKPLQLLNQDVYPRTWGIWRYIPGGPIVPAEYNYDTQTLGPYKFKEFYGYVPEYYSKKSTPDTRLLYKYLLDSVSAVACLFVNNTYVARVYDDCIEYIPINDPVRTDVRFFEEELGGMRYLLEVGFVKAKTQCFTVVSPPWMLLMDLDTEEVYLPNKGWETVHEKPAPIVHKDLGMYKRLLAEPDAVAVYEGMHSGLEIFIAR